jgi:hypothetical protein
VTNTESRDLVRQRASNRCEYRLLAQEHSHLAHHIEHIIARQHGGTDEAMNLALACQRCNLSKGPNLTGIDPATNEIVELFNPRRDQWKDHFRRRGARIEGITGKGRATVNLLAMNDARRLDLRRELLARGDFS